MFAKRASLPAILCLLLIAPRPIPAQDPATLLAEVIRAMGGLDLHSVRFSATGSGAVVGQNRNPEVAWPVSRVRAYTGAVDLDAGTALISVTRERGGREVTTEAYAGPDSPWSRQYAFWITPFGFLKGALEADATVDTLTKDGSTYRVVRYALDGRYPVTGYINDQDQVEWVETRVDNPVLGDMPVEVWFSEYGEFDGVAFPTLIIERNGGFPVSILAVSDVEPNFEGSVAGPGDDPPGPQDSMVESEEVADGVFYITGGSHHSVAVEFYDHVVVVEAPLDDERSAAVMAEVGRIAPGKPIRWVVNTHHHFDHAGGLRAYARAGAAIITQETNAAFLERALSVPRTLVSGDSPVAPMVVAIGESAVLSDPTETLELHWVGESPHHDGMLMAYLPDEKILIEADVYTPIEAPESEAAEAASVNLIENVERLRLDFETILPLHGDAARRRDLYAAVDRSVPDMEDILQPSRGESIDTRPPEVILMDEKCTTCHSMERITNQRFNALDWRAVLVRMQTIGAGITEDELDSLVDYLVANYGP